MSPIWKKYNLRQALKIHWVRTGEHGLTGKSHSLEEISTSITGELHSHERELTEKTGATAPIETTVPEVENKDPEKLHLQLPRRVGALERRIQRIKHFWRPELTASEKDLLEIEQRNRRITAAMKEQCRIANLKIPNALAQLGIVYYHTSKSKGESWKNQKVAFSCWRWTADGTTIYGHVTKTPYGHSPRELVSEDALMVMAQAVGRPVAGRCDDRGGGTLISISLCGTNDLPEFVDFGNVFKLINESAPPLTVCLGMTQNGGKKFVDLENAPHVLIAGTTGSGKSVGMINMLAQILGRNTPETVRLLLVDLKRLDLVNFVTDPPIPHLIQEIDGIPNGYVDRDDQVLPLLRWLFTENNRRQSLLSKHRVHNIGEWNRKHHRQALPRIVCAFDEYARLLRNKSIEKEFVSLCYDLASTSRATGIHMIISTQYAISRYLSTDIKMNFPARLCYSVPSLSGSLAMLETGEALNLYPPPGRCVWSWGVDRVKLQTPFISNRQLNEIVENARTGKTSKSVQLSGSLTEEALVRWALVENNNALPVAGAFLKFQNLISHRDLEDTLQAMDGKCFNIDGIDYQVRPPLGGAAGRILIKVAAEAEAETEKDV